MENGFLVDLEQRLIRMETSAKTEIIHNQEGSENILKIWTRRNNSSWTKYSPDHYQLVKVNRSSPLSIITVTHMEEEVEQVDFRVDISQPPDPVLVQFLASNLRREIQFCFGFEEEMLLLTNVDCSRVLIERLGGRIRVRSRACLKTIDHPASEDELNQESNKILSNKNNSAAASVCRECRALLGSGGGGDDGVKRELIESCPDFSGILDQEDENEDKLGQGQRYSSMGELISEKEEAGKEEIKDILSKVDQRKNRRQSQKKNESNDDDHDDEEEEQYNGNTGDGVDWRELGRKKKSSHPFRCPDSSCGETFAKEVAQISHILQHHPTEYAKVTEGWVKCTEPECFHVYREGVPHYTKHLINHLKSCHPKSSVLLAETGQKNECSYCGKIFKYNYSMKKHVESLHEAPTVPCHICGILLKGQKTLTSHLKSVHEKTVRHHCPEPGCTMTAVNSHHLKDHIAVVHRGQARYVCSVCGKEHGYYKALKHCQDRHKGRFMHPCTLCDKKYLDKVKLTVHMRVHTGEKPYSCPICATRMARLDNLSAHIKKTHGVTWQEAEKMTNTSVKGGPLVQKTSLEVG